VFAVAWAEADCGYTAFSALRGPLVAASPAIVLSFGSSGHEVVFGGWLVEAAHTQGTHRGLSGDDTVSRGWISEGTLR